MESTTSSSCVTCGCSLTLVFDFIQRDTYWVCNTCATYPYDTYEDRGRDD